MRPSLFARRDERGSILVLSTVGVVIAVISAALAVDLGRLAQAKRFDQKVADLAALDASRDLPRACAIAKESAVRNNFDPAGLDCIDPAHNPTKDVVIGRMVGGTFTPDPLGDAVQVRVSSPYKAAFPFVSGPDGVSVKAVASASEIAGFSIGSSLARVNASFKSPVLSRTLERLLGGSAGSLTLDAAGYQGLSSASLTLGEIAGRMGFATVDELLAADVKVRDLLDATATILNNQGVAGAAQVNQIKAVANSTMTVKLGDMIEVDQGVDERAASGKVNVLQMIVGSVELANKSNFAAGCVNVPNALDNALVTGVGRVGTDLCIKVTEGPQIYVGPVPGSATTSQVEITYDSTINVPISLPLLPLGVRAVGSLPVKVVAGGATATLTDIRCPSEANPGITVSVDTQAATTSVSGSVDLRVILTGALALANLNVTGHATGPAQTGVVMPFAHPGEFSPSAPSKTTPASPIATNLTATGSGTVSVLGVTLDVQVVNQAVIDASKLLFDEVSLRMRGQEMAALGTAVGVADVAALAEFFSLSACGNPALVA